LVLVLTLRVILDRLFVDLKLVGVMGARMVDRTDCRERDPVEEITNRSGGYTGSTGTRELGTPPDVSVEAGLDGAGGSSSGLGRVVRRFGIAPPRRSISFRRSRRMRMTPRMKMMRTVIDEATEMAMTAGLMKTN
jgi:hypothetical protein